MRPPRPSTSPSWATATSSRRGICAAAARETRVRSFLIARGALIKPWIFRELLDRPCPGIRPPPSVSRSCDASSIWRWNISATTRRVRAASSGSSCGTAVSGTATTPGGRTTSPPCGPSRCCRHVRRRPRARPTTLLLGSAAEDDHRLIWRRVLDRDYPGA